MKFFIQMEILMDQLDFTWMFGTFVLFFMAAMLGGIGIAQGDETFNSSYAALIVLAYWSMTFAVLSMLLNGIMLTARGVAWVWNKRGR